MLEGTLSLELGEKRLTFLILVIKDMHICTYAYTCAWYLRSLSFKQLALLWEAGDANVRILPGVDRLLEPQQRHVILQGIEIKLRMNNDL